MDQIELSSTGNTDSTVLDPVEADRAIGPDRPPLEVEAALWALLRRHPELIGSARAQPDTS